MSRLTHPQPVESEIRLARSSDEADLMALLREWHSESGEDPFDEDEVLGTLRRGLMRDMGLVGVVRGSKGIEGSIGVFIRRPWYSRSRHVEDLWNFVYPQFRVTPTGQGGHAHALLKFARWAAGELGQPLHMGLLTNAQTVRKLKLYERQFGSPAGVRFVVQTAAAP